MFAPVVRRLHQKLVRERLKVGRQQVRRVAVSIRIRMMDNLRNQRMRQKVTSVIEVNIYFLGVWF